MRIKALTRILAVRVRATHQAGHRCVQNAARLSRNTPLSMFLPRWSAIWAPHRPEPRHHHRPTGGFAPLGARHAGDTPKGDSSCCKPPPLHLVSCSLTGAGLPGQVQFNVGEASSAMTGDVMVGQLREDACVRWGVTPDREDSTPSDRVESSLTG